MSHPSKKRRPRRRWFQFSLRTLLAVMTLVAGLAVAWRIYVEPYRRQRQTMKLIENLGGSYQTVAAPGWLRRLFGQDFQNVTLVNLADCDDPAGYLGQVAALPALETLVVGGPAFTDDQLRRLKEVSSLTGLVLDCTNVTDAGIHDLHEALPYLEVYESQRRAIAALGASVQYGHAESHLRLQQLVGSEWFRDAYRADFQQAPTANDLIQLKRLKRLQTIILDRCRVTDSNLAGLKSFAELRRLSLGGPPITDDGLANLKQLSQLRDLKISQTGISDAGLAHLESLAELEILDLSDTQVGDAGLARLKGMSQLRHLNLHGTKVTDAALEHLNGLTNLKTLNVELTKVSRKGVADLQEALPTCRISVSVEAPK